MELCTVSSDPTWFFEHPQGDVAKAAFRRPPAPTRQGATQQRDVHALYRVIKQPWIDANDLQGPAGMSGGCLDGNEPRRDGTGIEGSVDPSGDGLFYTHHCPFKGVPPGEASGRSGITTPRPYLQCPLSRNVVLQMMKRFHLRDTVMSCGNSMKNKLDKRI